MAVLVFVAGLPHFIKRPFCKMQFTPVLSPAIFKELIHYFIFYTRACHIHHAAAEHGPLPKFPGDIFREPVQVFIYCYGAVFQQHLVYVYFERAYLCAIAAQA